MVMFVYQRVTALTALVMAAGEQNLSRRALMSVLSLWGDAEFFQMPRRYYSFIHQMMLVFLIVCHTIPIFEAVQHTLQRLE